MNDTFDPNSFVSLAKLVDSVDVGQIATAIEKTGIYGWDKFGRFKAFSTGSAEAAEALELLAEYQGHEIKRGPLEASLWDSCDLRDKPCHYGWPEQTLPDFADPQGQKVNLSALTTEENNALVLLAAFCKAGGFDVTTGNRTRVADAKSYVELTGMSMSEKTVRKYLDKVASILKK